MRLERENEDASKTEKALSAAHPAARPVNWRKIVLVTITRPMRMFLEPMVLFVDLFLVLEYAMFFLYFEAYPHIFRGIPIYFP